MHEEPQVPNFLSRSLRGSGDFRIEPGLVIAVEPMVNMGTKRVKMLRDHWTQSTLDRKPSAHFEHTIAVTRNGPVLLTAAPSPEEIAELPWDFAAGSRGRQTGNVRRLSLSRMPVLPSKTWAQISANQPLNESLLRAIY